MSRTIKFLIVLLILLAFNVAVVSATDVNSTDYVELDYNQTSLSIDYPENSLDDVSQEDANVSVEKTNPVFTIKSANIKSRDTLTIYFKNSTGSPLASKNFTAVINDKKYSLSTNSNGMSSIKLVLPAKTYKLTLDFAGDDDYNNISKSFNVKVSKIDTMLDPYTNFLLRGKYLHVDLYNANGDLLPSKKVNFKINGKIYSTTTDRNGMAKLKMNFNPSKYSLTIKFDGNDYYKASKMTFTFYIMYYTTIDIANSRLLSNGYLRIYLKDHSTSAISHKNLAIKIADKKFSKKTTAEGIVVIKPQLGAENYNVLVKYGKLWVFKKVKGIIGNVKDPLKESIPLKNGVPDIDLMPGNYVMGDDSATYTLTKEQYLEVLKRDSYCLFLNNKLSKYTFFKTKHHPNTNHILKREKWNVIERALNTKLVRANNYNYWPNTISASLKGKSYTYSEVRDVQNTEYTCGPTSASVCSQVLRNFISEKYLAKKAGSKEIIGTSCYQIIRALGKNFNCTYFYKPSFKSALKELQKGGCALIFHTKNHYVAVLDISKDGKKVLVSNSYGSFYNIPTTWLSVKYMNTRFIKNHEDSLIIRLNYSLSSQTKDSVNCFYNSMGTNWIRQNTNAMIGFT